ncbi:phosphatase PAP2 family protein [Sphingomonas sp. MMS24-J13]|uniref:phosphatase PAP2 family protein n=1 Tax=Sphingomonas sp. MMS24-J13 TaxID=3238686 RepID=UPI00385003E5
MRRTLALVLAATVLVAAKPGPAGPLLLNEANFDPALLLPPPPADGSAIAKAELAALFVVDRTRTPAEEARAKTDNRVKDVTIFAAIMGPGFDLDRLPATKALFQTVRAEEKAAADRAKDHFLRNRPWIVDKTLHPCSTDDEPQSSYPSGHATMGYAMAAVLADLVPTKAPAILARAADYGHSRLVCEMHFASDVTAGQTYGMLIAERLMQQPAFQAQFRAAAAELQSFH